MTPSTSAAMNFLVSFTASGCSRSAAGAYGCLMGNPVSRAFSSLAQAATVATGSAWAFVLAVATIVLWGLLGPTFGYSDSWQLVINTGTTIITFLMVFVIQHAQDKEMRAIQLKLDELIGAT